MRMTNCPACGAANSARRESCFQCGAALPTGLAEAGLAPGPTASAIGGVAPARALAPVPRQIKVLLVLTIVFAFLFPPVGLVCAIIALAQLARDPSRRGLALVSLVMVVMNVVLLIVAVGLLRESNSLFERASRMRPPGAAGQRYRPSTEVGAKYDCLSHLTNLALAADMWAHEHGGKLPRADQWVDDLGPYLRDPNQFKCSDDTSSAASSYAMNAALSGVDIGTISNPEQVVLFYETAHPGSNPSGGRDDLAPARHRGEVNVAYLNGHAASVGPGAQVSFGPQ